MPSTLLSLVFLTAVSATPLNAATRDAADCQPCNPKGATGTNPPDVGSDLQNLYIDLLDSVKGISFESRSLKSNIEGRDSTLCCRETLDCVNVQNLNIPMCYDKFTTNFQFADGTFGSLTTGEYNDQDGSKANLIEGNFTKANGETGDIYSDDPGAKPNTATLSIPPQWTGTGVGTPIPATEIASNVPITAPASNAATTPSTAQITSGTAAAGSQNTAPVSSSSHGAAFPAAGAPGSSFVVSVLSGILYVLYGI